MTGIKWLDISMLVFNSFIFFFAVSVMLSYLILAFISARALKRYMKQNRFVNYKALLSLPDAPRVSLIAPASNEGFTIKENVQSLLAINYNNYDVIVVNDGSKDDSIPILMKAYDLVESEKKYYPLISTKNVKAIYVSNNPAFSKLIVVDKINGGKADA